nr:reverse transcriptase domain-containing protein [Tanacetum cinerariifolium]
MKRPKGDHGGNIRQSKENKHETESKEMFFWSGGRQVLGLYVSKKAVSSVLLTDRKGKQSFIQYASRTLNEAKRNYAPMEKVSIVTSTHDEEVEVVFRSTPSEGHHRSAHKADPQGEIAKHCSRRGMRQLDDPDNTMPGEEDMAEGQERSSLGREKAGWVDELPNFLWSHRTSIKTSNGETPFSLTYGSEVVIPAEICMPTYRTMMIREGLNKEEIRLNLDLLTERRELAAIQEAKYKKKLEQYYNKKVYLTIFKPREFVFQKNKTSRVEYQGKLGPKWEGPYRVAKAYQNGSYKLQTMEDKEVPRTWHAINLSKCYCRNYCVRNSDVLFKMIINIKPLLLICKKGQFSKDVDTRKHRLLLDGSLPPEGPYDKISKVLAKRVQSKCMAPKGKILKSLKA